MTSNADWLDGDALWEALARFVSGESPDGEAAQVRRWLAAHPDDERFVRLVRQLGEPLPQADVEAALRRFNAEHDRDR